MRLGTAEKSATFYGQSVAGYRRDRRASDGWHSYLVTDARVTPPVAANYRPARDALPALCRPHGLIHRKAGRFAREYACVDATAIAVERNSKSIPPYAARASALQLAAYNQISDEQCAVSH